MAYLDIVNNTDGFNHIALFYPADSGNPIFLTRGAWEVADKILGFDSEKQIVYVLALADEFSCLLTRSTSSHQFENLAVKWIPDEVIS